MKLAIVGTGVSGLVAAWKLHKRHELTVFEANDSPGGHAATVDCDAFGERWSVDTGFMVFNHHTYPKFCKLLAELGVASQASDMSFSVRSDATQLEYQGSSLRGLFAQRLNLVRPRFHKLLAEIIRFNRAACRYLGSHGQESEFPHSAQQHETPPLALGEFLDRHHFSRHFRDHYLLPMTAAIWSAKPTTVETFPARFILGFCRNHGLLQIRNRPQWRTIVDGSRTYVNTIIAPWKDSLRLSSPITRIERGDRGVYVTPARDEPQRFDGVVLATHADQSLRMLADATPDERQFLQAFPYQPNHVVLHTDISQLPVRREAWASWNYRVNGDADSPASVTYDLSRLQNIPSPSPLLITLNPNTPIADDKVLQTFQYDHPLFSHDAIAEQRNWERVNGQRATWYCGAYCRYGFHEDGVVSGLAVASSVDKFADLHHAHTTSEKSSPIEFPAPSRRQIVEK